MDNKIEIICNMENMGYLGVEYHMLDFIYSSMKLLGSRLSREDIRDALEGRTSGIAGCERRELFNLKRAWVVNFEEFGKADARGYFVIPECQNYYRKYKLLSTGSDEFDSDAERAAIKCFDYSVQVERNCLKYGSKDLIGACLEGYCYDVSRGYYNKEYFTIVLEYMNLNRLLAWHTGKIAILSENDIVQYRKLRIGCVPSFDFTPLSSYIRKNCLADLIEKDYCDEAIRIFRCCLQIIGVVGKCSSLTGNAREVRISFGEEVSVRLCRYDSRSESFIEMGRISCEKNSSVETSGVLKKGTVLNKDRYAGMFDRMSAWLHEMVDYNIRTITFKFNGLAIPLNLKKTVVSGTKRWYDVELS